MSADNWRQCPACLVRAVAAAEAKIQAAAEAYGKVPPEEYERLKREAAELNPEHDMEDTLREDYELGTSTSGEFAVSYSCSCTACGFRHQFKHREQLKVPYRKAKVKP